MLQQTIVFNRYSRPEACQQSPIITRSEMRMIHSPAPPVHVVHHARHRLHQPDPQNDLQRTFFTGLLYTICSLSVPATITPLTNSLHKNFPQCHHDSHRMSESSSFKSVRVQRPSGRCRAQPKKLQSHKAWMQPGIQPRTDRRMLMRKSASQRRYRKYTP